MLGYGRRPVAANNFCSEVLFNHVFKVVEDGHTSTHQRVGRLPSSMTEGLANNVRMCTENAYKHGEQKEL
jgi:hypothetical protein